MTTPDFNQVVAQTRDSVPAGLSFDDPMLTLVVLIFITLLIERALSAIFNTGIWDKIKVPFNDLGIGSLKIYTAIVVNVVLAFTMHLDAFGMLLNAPATTLGMLITGLFCSGGAKAWADIYRQFNDIRNGKVEQEQLKSRVMMEDISSNN